MIQQLRPSQDYRIIPELFLAKTRLHSGWKARLVNSVLVGTFNLLPKPWIKPFGRHRMAFAIK